MDNLQYSIESELRLYTELFESNIQTIGCYISENAGQIKCFNTNKKGSLTKTATVTRRVISIKVTGNSQIC